jgi:putative ABC transport system permease protein
MLKNYFKVAFRNLWKNKAFSAINIIGLASGLGICLLILLYVLDEMSYDGCRILHTGLILAGGYLVLRH